ncbi:MAG: response regulator [Bacteroidetes bacterium]|jgi:DNA-binding NarL/FixJ family response regulator|nr:response regulator [Bacteroidota bacterium]
MKRLIVADDHAVVRTGVQIIFNATHDMRIVDECSTGEELLVKLDNGNYDGIILDLSMPGKDAFGILDEIKLMNPTLPVVVFTMNGEHNYALRLFQKGASGYINKESDPAILVDCMRTALTGKKYYTSRQLELISEYMIENEGDTKSGHQQLTDREFQVMYLIVSGIKKSEIAKKLSVSSNTVDNHRSNIMRKLSLKSNTELTLYAVHQGIIR